VDVLKLQTQIIAQKIAEFRRRLPTIDSGLMICISELAIMSQSMVMILMREKRERERLLQQYNIQEYMKSL
jgi:hypothetical protein